MSKHEINLVLSEREREIIPLAIEAGRDLFTGICGKRSRIQDQEAASMKLLLLEGKDVPAIALAVACFGLEVLWWKENRRIVGIPELLARLERLCGYRRTGGEAPRKGR